MLYDRTWIEENIPHKLNMCLLDNVLSFSENMLVCDTRTHQMSNHPLAVENGVLGAMTGIEYAAQAMAIHGVLVREAEGNPIKPKKGYLVSVRDVVSRIDRLDTVQSTIIVSVKKIAGDIRMLIYDFELSSQGNIITAGRASVIPDADQS
ncbi:MAG: hypothetical protein JHC38_00050 [Thiotrichales bacterium]|jgi:predicted hotdog family 3-hydroxylacyl-ACP dehydratase|nr:hypothetical protein [Thiotrichales bacterium]